MPKYLVPITRDCSETTMVDIEAADERQAVSRALTEVYNKPWEFTFTHDDRHCPNEPYFAGDDDYSAVELAKPPSEAQ